MEAMADSEKHMQGFSLHYYCGWAGDPVNFTRISGISSRSEAERMDEILNRHWSIIKGYGMEEHAKLVD